jgi:NAD+ synthase (glutamine-hydrolysing)
VSSLAFLNPFAHGFARVAVAVPRLRVADPAFNAAESVTLLEQAAAQGAVVVAFPELGLSAYTCDDLFHRLFNCAVVVFGGRVLGVVPKTYLPNYGEFYEARQFNGGDTALAREVRLLGADVPFGAELLFKASNLPLLTIHCEICEDVWVPIPPSSYAALAGATVLINLSASNITIGKADYRHRLVSLQSARCLAAYLYSSAGLGESTTDLGWDGQSLIYESGELLAQSERFVAGSHFISADVDLDRVSRERMRQNSFGTSVEKHKARLAEFRTVAFELPLPTGLPMALQRRVERFPYVPAEAARKDERCSEVYNIQVLALVQRLSASGITKLVIGVSGGLDSTHALLVCARATDVLGLPRANILAYTMPGFATSARTLAQARRLMTVVRCTAGEIDIRPSCERMLADIGHPYARGERVFDVTFENVQAGERTSHLFRLANLHGGLVVGTGDLSELALGWSTYGVGDQMSHYNVNASVPKTLIKHLVRWVAQSGSVAAGDDDVLDEILATEISPELVPSERAGEPGQRSEASIGPYELQDFHLYQVLRYGFAPTKVAFLAYTAWHDRTLGAWPDGPEVTRNEYSLAEIKKHLGTFLYRFFKTSQFKRSAMPNAPKVGSGGSLSPRGDWRAPSDSEATVWLADLARVPDSP